jgi:hypothetical protein
MSMVGLGRFRNLICLRSDQSDRGYGLFVPVKRSGGSVSWVQVDEEMVLSIGNKNWYLNRRILLPKSKQRTFFAVVTLNPG